MTWKQFAWTAPLLLGLALSGASAKPHHPAPPKPVAPKHNFVGFDLAPLTPPANPPYPPYMEQFVDTASIAHKGDIVSFDVLQLTSAKDAAPAQSTLQYRESCGWRSSNIAPAPGSTGWSDVRLLLTFSRETLLVDEACAGSVKAATGYTSADAASADWAKLMTDARPPPPAPSFARGNDVAHPAWVDAPHGFVSVFGDSEMGNRLFFDQTTATHDATSATGLSLVVLGAESQRRSEVYDLTSALRNVRYDCAGRTMTVIGEAGWNKFGRLVDAFSTQATPRSAAQSPVIAAEIDAACSPGEKPARRFPSVMAAWSFAHENWPPSVTLTQMQCLWVHLPEERRAGFLKTPTQVELVPDDEQPALLAACAIPANQAGNVRHNLIVYANSRSALAATKLDEDRLLAAWNAMPWETHLRMAAARQAWTPAQKDWEADQMSELARQLGYQGDRAALKVYCGAMAVLDES